MVLAVAAEVSLTIVVSSLSPAGLNGQFGIPFDDHDTGFLISCAFPEWKMQQKGAKSNKILGVRCDPGMVPNEIDPVHPSLFQQQKVGDAYL